MQHNSKCNIIPKATYSNTHTASAYTASSITVTANIITHTASAYTASSTTEHVNNNCRIHIHSISNYSNSILELELHMKLIHTKQQ